MSNAYLEATMTRREEIVGRPVFEVFPDNPEEAGASGVRNLTASLQRVVATQKPESMPIQRYDMRQPTGEGGAFQVRYWSPRNSPVFGPDGTLYSSEQGPNSGPLAACSSLETQLSAACTR